MFMEVMYDMVTVGAGTGGVVSAITAAKNGLNVCLIDSKLKKYIGDKVCGDIVCKNYFDTLYKRTGIYHPEGNELKQEVSGLKIISPDKKTSIQLGGDHYMIDRYMFGQRLVNSALDEGATLLDGLRALYPLIEDNTVVGVVAKNTHNNSIVKVSGKITVDASGAMPALRNDVMLNKSFLENFVSKSDMAIAYREVRELKNDVPDKEFAKIYISNEDVSKGYTWIFPDGDHIVNVGVGAAITSNNPGMKDNFVKRIMKNPLFDGSRVIEKGGGVLPTRMPLRSLVANGFMCVGDAGCQVNPISGAGIEFSMTGGYLAAMTAVDAIDSDDVTQDMLWRYNRDYMSAHGTTQAMLSIFKIFLHSCSNSDLNFGMKHLVSDETVAMINSGIDVNVPVVKKAKTLLKEIVKAMLISDFSHTIVYMKRVKELCENYPDPSGFMQWNKELDVVYSDVSRVFMK